MARETKVGLIAGLAFIICFAVILSNRGRRVPQPEDPQPRFQYVDTETSVPPASTRRPSQRRNAPGTHGVPINPPRRAATEQRTTNTDLDSEPPPASSGPSDPRRRPQDTHVADARSSDDSTDDADRVRRLEDRLDALSRKLALEGRRDFRMADDEHSQTVTDTGIEPAPPRSQPARQATANSVPGTTRELGRHTVTSGDTLSRIAVTYYGSKSRRLIDALADANRGILSDPDVLRIGMKLVIPVVAGFEQPGKGTSARTVKPGQDDAEPRRPRTKTNETRPIRWYQIKKNDRYVSIARNELGDESRWQEIFELNKKTFPDPSRIRSGVRIKLPAVAVADSSRGTNR
ncbi:MAG: LysM peptidoglycan-binding domain-containing protein [Planctomycetes bacterium]|nr:LysM peptidoglycan-binding domain-containing protein [Planctomycetota bacterium]